MKAVIHCSVCADAKRVEVEDEDPKMFAAQLATSILAYHATVPHANHRLILDFDGQQAKHPTLKIKCLANGCSRNSIQIEIESPMEMVAAFVLLFHTAHEGHAMEMSYMGKTWKSPV